MADAGERTAAATTGAAAARRVASSARFVGLALCVVVALLLVDHRFHDYDRAAPGPEAGTGDVDDTRGRFEGPIAPAAAGRPEARTQPEPGTGSATGAPTPGGGIERASWAGNAAAAAPPAESPPAAPGTGAASAPAGSPAPGAAPPAAAPPTTAPPTTVPPDDGPPDLADSVDGVVTETADVLTALLCALGGAC